MQTDVCVLYSSTLHATMRPRRPGQSARTPHTDDSSTRVYSGGYRSSISRGGVASTSGLRRPARRRELRASRKHAGMTAPIRLSTAVRRRVRAAGPDRNFCPGKTQHGCVNWMGSPSPPQNFWGVSVISAIEIPSRF